MTPFIFCPLIIHCASLLFRATDPNKSNLKARVSQCCLISCFVQCSLNGDQAKTGLDSNSKDFSANENQLVTKMSPVECIHDIVEWDAIISVEGQPVLFNKRESNVEADHESILLC